MADPGDKVTGQILDRVFKTVTDIDRPNWTNKDRKNHLWKKFTSLGGKAGRLKTKERGVVLGERKVHQDLLRKEKSEGPSLTGKASQRSLLANKK
eukprot:gene5207-5274_t